MSDVDERRYINDALYRALADLIDAHDQQPTALPAKEWANARKALTTPCTCNFPPRYMHYIGCPYESLNGIEWESLFSFTGEVTDVSAGVTTIEEVSES